MRLLVFGKTGQVGQELVRRAPPDVTVTALGRGDADLTRPRDCAAAIGDAACDAVVNAAAYTDVDGAETAEPLATRINATAPAAMAGAAADKGVPFLHISTDYVFDGSGVVPWTPEARTAPLGAYGRSKLAGEVAVRAAGGRHAILRTSWVFSAHGRNFVKTMLRLARGRDRLDVVADQVGGPTPAADVAAALLTLAKSYAAGHERSGIHHFAGTPDVSWADFAREIFARSGTAVSVTDISAKDYPTAAKRPANSRLDCGGLAREFGITRPDWRAGLAAVLRELKDATE